MGYYPTSDAMDWITDDDRGREINGRGGNDRFYGGAGNDVLTGGFGAAFPPSLKIPPIGEQRAIERRLIARHGVAGAEKMPARADLGHRLQAKFIDRKVQCFKNATIIWIISASSTIFSNDAVKPPSSQPSPCFRKLQWARKRGHSDIIVS